MLPKQLLYCSLYKNFPWHYKLALTFTICFYWRSDTCTKSCSSGSDSDRRAVPAKWWEGVEKTLMRVSQLGWPKIKVEKEAAPRFTLVYILGEWVSFSFPGTYRMFIRSHTPKTVSGPTLPLTWRFRRGPSLGTLKLSPRGNNHSFSLRRKLDIIASRCDRILHTNIHSRASELYYSNIYKSSILLVLCERSVQ